MRDAKNKHTAVVIEKRNNCFMSKTKQNLWEGCFTLQFICPRSIFWSQWCLCP